MNECGSISSYNWLVQQFGQLTLLHTQIATNHKGS